MNTAGASTPRASGIHKSNSTASAGARSTKSHESVLVVGVHPLGTLRVLRPERSPRSTEQDPAVCDGDDDDQQDPPPLDPPDPPDSPTDDAYAYHLSGSRSQQHAGFSARPPRRPRDGQTHDMGGGDVIIILDLPPIFVVGYDAVSFMAKGFAGVRDIPAGPHFFWVAHPSGIAARAGVWLFASETHDRVHVVQWDRYNEALTEPTRSESRNHAEAVPNIHAKLVPHPDPSAVGPSIGHLSSSRTDANLRIWTQLTNSVTPSLLDRIAGPQTGGWITHTLDRAYGVVQFSAEVQLERAVPNKNLQQRQLKFTFERTTRLFSRESFGSERSLQAIDPTDYVLSQIEDPGNDLAYEDLVGEFQFSFVVGVLLGNDACLDQWWFMALKLLVKSHLLVRKRPLLAASLLRTLTAQVTYGTSWVDTTMLDPSEHNCRELRVGLIVYKRRMEEFLQGDGDLITPNHLAVGTAFSRLESTLTGLGWDLGANYPREGTFMLEDGEEVTLEHVELDAEDERGEWAPEIVELDEHGRQRDLISWND
ncbi:uncharacterized protein UV8b_07883 [Ustilaginoidea virens]|uniref:Uncharacterized protein n=1 Tax=Ustilaginoidea virens TaxID=1159556 RepID=A0A063C4X5_USTVR|nr:uncharacterized protein UV8b_07883 [Ustilaginoidea virens]QUC23642.1 hypothetical protein UV8b_07883 [Ustilaginoidea virens]GAO17526.1 hypothetical protein UVI_02002950 [Ustilaginoidea virens]